MSPRAGNVPTYIAIGLAALAAIMSGPYRHTDVDAALLRLLTSQAWATDMPLHDPEGPIAYTSP